MTAPIVAITMGDACGVGAEVIMKALAWPEVHALCRPLVIGDVQRLQLAGRIVGTRLSVESLQTPEQANYSPDRVNCIDLKLIPGNLPFGQISAIAGEAAF